MQSAEIRKRFLAYFANHQHTVVESASLVPQNDPTLMFTAAGMVPFKDVFLGRESRPYKRATSCQKCVRAGGKHNDLENVGYTARHHTFFEMLGNFSFGDYFKEEAIKLAWDFVTKELKLPVEKLYVTVFRDDDEAASIWREKIGVAADRIVRMDEKDNFWQMGDTGPCGPCTEIFIDRGAARGRCPNPDSCKVGCECDRFIEFWNLVFMQFDRSKDGTMSPLPKPSVDTGAGLERLAAILQDVDSNYQIDTFRGIIGEIERLSNVTYEQQSEKSVSFHVMADHARAVTFLIGDGVLPANEGRGYVLRRIIRRAVRHSKKLGFSQPVLFRVCQFIVSQMSQAYPELSDKAAFIAKMVSAEEDLFLRTLERGLELLDQAIAGAKKSKVIPGDVAFKLYDTFGFPLDLTRVIARESGIDIDEPGFERAMERQREQSRQNWQGSGGKQVVEVYQELSSRLDQEGNLPEFVGYECESVTAKCVALLRRSKGGGLAEVDAVTQLGQDEVFEAVFVKTPLYGESGGQVGDIGEVKGDGGSARVLDVQRPVPNLIVAHLDRLQGAIKVSGEYLQSIDSQRRALIKRNHTATHLLHAALRQVLGDHVKQAGSLVNAEMLRFDFTHFQALTSNELTEVEKLVCQQIWQDIAVESMWLDKDAALASGAIAFFGEKYGERVRVLKAGDFSIELCGGTHVSRTGEIQLFKLISEAAIASGVRRVVAYTSKRAYEHLSERDREVTMVRGILKSASMEETESKLAKSIATEKALRRQLDEYAAIQLTKEAEELAKLAQEVSGVSMIVARCSTGDQGVKRLRDFADRLKERLSSKTAVVLGMESPEKDKAFVLASISKDLTASLKAQDLIKHIAPHIEGKGGGKADMAQAGGNHSAGLDQALNAARDYIQGNLRPN